MGFGVWVLGVEVWGLGFGSRGLVFEVEVWGSGLGFGALSFRVSGFRF